MPQINTYTQEICWTSRFTPLFCSLITIILNTSWSVISLTTELNQFLEQDLTINIQRIGVHLSTDFILPFELISIILLITLVGAITMARREETI